MKSNEIREKFLEYFAGQHHARVESSPLVPHDDQTLLFTNAGMVQFKRVFMGEEKRPYNRAVSAQRCVRAGGKHNDLENVGYTARHHTFFEMLGNFSFGDYFKQDAIFYAWNFLTKSLALPKERLWVTIFRDDDEAFDLWQKADGLPVERIVRLGEKDNFWAMGDIGPCGPCSEILIDQGPEVGCKSPDCRVGCDCDRYLELWNLVFMQYYRDADGLMTPLPKPCIDTGMGLERIAAIMQGKTTNYEGDLFSGLIAGIAELSGTTYGADEKQAIAMRVIADHGRATAFLIADGVLPANDGRGYVLRRIMRRAIRFGRVLGLTKPFLSFVTDKVVAMMADAHPHLLAGLNLMQQVVRHEEERFLETLDFGLGMLTTELDHLRGRDQRMISGDFLFKLYDTYGLPVDIVRDLTREDGFLTDEEGFNQAMAAQRALSRKSWKSASMDAAAGLKSLAEQGQTSLFVGYETRYCLGKVLGLLDGNGNSRDSVAAGETAAVVCDQTPFYAESGGQVGDQGEIIGPAGRARVVGTESFAGGLIVHRAEILDGDIAIGQEVELLVWEGERQRIANNHTATHLLQATLKKVLGDHVRQSGSLVSPERLRFDFTHFSPLTAEELQQIETMVNEAIRSNISVGTALLAREEAIRGGAMALFGEKYVDTVRVVSVGAVSRELCGGTHVRATGEIGLFKIVSEAGIAAGVRRIEALTGPDALSLVQKEGRVLQQLTNVLKVLPEELEGKLSGLISRNKELEREISQLTARLAAKDLDSLIKNAQTIAGIRVLAAQVPMDSPKTLREVGDRLREKMGIAVAVLGGSFEGKAALLAIVSKELTSKCNAGQIIKEVATLVGGSGGGRPDMAQAGGPLVDKLPQALDAVYGIVERMAGR